MTSGAAHEAQEARPVYSEETVGVLSDGLARKGISPLPAGVHMGRLSAEQFNPSGIAPLDHRVLILADEPEGKTKGGVYLPDSELTKQKYAATTATVVAVGAMAWAELKHDARQFGIAASWPQPGTRVLVGRYTGDRHKGADGKDYTVINDADIIGILED